MVRRWWHNFLDSFTYLNDKDIRWLQRNDWFYKHVHNFPKSAPQLIVECTSPAFLSGMILVISCIIMVFLYFAKTTLDTAECGSIGFLGFIVMLGLLKKQAQICKILLISLSMSRTNSICSKTLIMKNMRGSATKTLPDVVKDCFASVSVDEMNVSPTVHNIMPTIRRIIKATACRIWENLRAGV